MSKNFSDDLQSVMDILKEVVKLPQRNKSFVSIFILTSVCYAILMITSNPIPAVTSMDLTNHDYLKQLYKDTMILYLYITVVSFLSMVTTIHVSAMSYLGRESTLKDIFPKFKKMWIRTVVTWFYFTLMSAGFFMLVSPIFLLILTKGLIVVLTIGIVLVLLAICLYMYLAFVWMLSIVISVLEDCYGLQALGKGAELLKGRKVVGFALTFVLMILIGVNVLVSNIMTSVTAMNFAVLVKMFSMMIYTLFYFECKQSHGEEVEVEENIEYAQVSTLPVVDLKSGM